MAPNSKNLGTLFSIEENMAFEKHKLIKNQVPFSSQPV